MLIFQDYTHLQFENFYFDAQLLKRTRFSISTEKYKTPTPRCVDEGRDRNKADIRKKKQRSMSVCSLFLSFFVHLSHNPFPIESSD